MATTTITVDQGTHRTIVISGIVDGSSAAMDVTGWTVRAVARVKATDSTILAEWVSGTPTGAQGSATASGTSVRLVVTPIMSRAWPWETAELHVHIIEPVAPFREEDISDSVNLINRFTTVH